MKKENKYNMPNVSVIIPVYNVENYLKECLDSIVNQTLKDIEIICINDGSTDSSLEILNKYKDNDNRIIVIDKKNEGQAKARNMGIEIATGDYICFVDSDDYCDLTMLEKSFLVAKEKNIDLVLFEYFDFKFTNLGKELYKASNNYVVKNKIFNYKDIQNEILDCVYSGPVAKIWKRSFIERNEIPKFDSMPVSEDMILAAMSALYADSIYYFDSGLYYYRRDRKEQTTQSKSYLEHHIFTALDNIKKRVKKHPDYNLILNSLRRYTLRKVLWNIRLCISSFDMNEVEDFYIYAREYILKNDIYINMNIKDLGKKNFSGSVCLPKDYERILKAENVYEYKKLEDEYNNSSIFIKFEYFIKTFYKFSRDNGINMSLQKTKQTIKKLSK